MQIGAGDPFWVQVREAIFERARQLSVKLVPIDLDEMWHLPGEDQLSLIEELVVQDIDALIASSCPEEMAVRLIDLGRPIVHLTEHPFRHPMFISPLGLYDVGRTMGEYIAAQLGGRGNVLILGGMMQLVSAEDGRTRIAGFEDALCDYPEIRLRHIRSLWEYEEGYARFVEAPWRPGEHLDAIFGLSDSMALAGRDAGRALGLVDDHTLVVGVNGDPLALAAIVEGSMAATIETSAADFGRQAVDLARRAALGHEVPAHFSYKPRLVTAENVAEVAAQKLLAIANLPTQLIGVNRRLEQQRVARLETSLAINRRVGVVLDRQRLAIEIANLIRDSYGYDVVQLFLWNEQEQVLIPEPSAQHGADSMLPLAEAGLLGHAVQQNEPIFVPDARRSHRFAPDPRCPDTVSRAILPIRLGDTLLGLLDLHSSRPTQHSRQEIIGLQSLTDQLGIAMRNAELYSDAIRARATAEQADQLKTRLLANVSHELRTPLNVILGYSASALGSSGIYGIELPPELRHDMRQIYHAGEHLLRVINDLLDLSRAEINELDLFPEPLDTHKFLAEIFESMHESLASSDAVAWRLELPSQLPLIQADPVRLRQVLLNLLSNAHKYTSRGSIALGAAVTPPQLHLWIADTGVGIPVDLQERIFEPFVTSVQSPHRPEGIGLGLSITRRLVALHGGTMSLESQPGHGSTFHVYLPLPSLAGRLATIPAAGRPALLLIASHEHPVVPVAELCQRQGWAIVRLRSAADLRERLRDFQPVALAWDLAQATQSDWEIVQQIRGLPQLGQLPLIVYGQDRPGMLDLSIGLTNYLVKPLSGQTLIDALSAMRPAAEAEGPILIVDDDPQALRLYQSLAATALPGYPVRAADGGAAALAILAEEVPSLVILDLIMPDVDGFAVLDRLRARPETRRVPVLVMSGRTLSLEDIRRLDYSLVTYQSKDILTSGEAGESLRRALATTDALPQPTSLLVKQAIGYLQQHHARAISRHELANHIGVSKDYLSHIFHQELGISPWEYLNRYRVRQAKALLRDTSQSITEIALRVGFEDLSYFSRVFNKHAGCSPRAYREQE
jgi:signal transduction histidine kinase/AraC-like DNA-binding protein/ABC-type sugar transport system substrate-binding protein/DNA-binding response OmpR family regulator